MRKDLKGERREKMRKNRGEGTSLDFLERIRIPENNCSSGINADCRKKIRKREGEKIGGWAEQTNKVKSERERADRLCMFL